MATTTTTHKTRRGELMAKLQGKKIGAGHYAIRGYEAKMIREASGSKPGLWAVTHDGLKAFEAAHLTEVLEVIDQIFSPRPAETEVAVEAVTETAPAEAEVIDETPAPVTPEVPAEPVVTEVQDVITLAPIPSPKKMKTRTPKTRRTELLDKLGARTLGTAEYAVAGHHVEYVAPGVMPRNAGGRWRTTLLSDEGVVVSWNLSLTAALEVVESRVQEIGDAEFEGAAQDTLADA